MTTIPSTRTLQQVKDRFDTILGFESCAEFTKVDSALADLVFKYVKDFHSVDPDFPLPYVFPTPEGGISLEWDTQGTVFIDMKYYDTDDHTVSLWCIGQSCEIPEQAMSSTDPQVVLDIIHAFKEQHRNCTRIG